MNIVDLRQTSVRQIEPLLEEEARHWRDELHWDYRGALELIKRFLDAHALAGCVAFENGAAAGYSFYVLEDQKGLIGGLYVSPNFPRMPSPAACSKKCSSPCAPSLISRASKPS
jgi:hypothetical protein